MKNRLIAVVLAALCLLAALAGCGGKDRQVVGTCAGYDVLYEELRFVANSIRESEKDLSAEELKQAVADRIAADYAVLTAAKEFFPELSLTSPEIWEAVDAAVNEAVEEYGSKSAYKSALKEYGLTENYARLLLGRAEVELKWKTALESRLFAGTELEDETAFAAWLQSGNLVRVRRITVADAETAGQIRADLAAGKSPEQTTEGKTGAELSTKFYLVRGYSADKELEADAFSLTKENLIGEVRSTENGYRILILEENDMESFAAYQLSTYYQKMREAKYDAESEAILSAAAKENAYLPNDLGNSIDLTTIR